MNFKERIFNRAADGPRKTRLDCAAIAAEADLEIMRLRDLLDSEFGSGWEDFDRAKFSAMQREIRRMRDRIERLRGLCKSASGWLLDAGDSANSEVILGLVGDMEKPLGPNVRVEPPKVGSNEELYVLVPKREKI
jgi:hypothetical protein